MPFDKGSVEDFEPQIKVALMVIAGTAQSVGDTLELDEAVSLIEGQLNVIKQLGGFSEAGEGDDE